ncbi:MAG TPA: PAS domain-containing protein [Candidatus Nanoarchaeia archaeon]|nr:PAS domain-containing protein [Candidatus Nanoarchaeia archaeon]
MSQSTKIDHAMLLKIADTVPAIVALYNINTGEYVYVNKALAKILGYEPQEFIDGGMEFIAGLVHPDDVDDVMKKNQAALEYANMQDSPEEEIVATFEYRLKHKSSGWRWVRTEGTVFSRNESGKVDLLLNVSLDITERKDAQLRLMKSLRLLEGVLHPPNGT